jgi:hypothetical protein
LPHCSELPAWVSYLQALAVPIIGVFIGAFAGLIAARQMWIADEKLRLDTFDKRYDRRVALYEATRKVLGSVFRQTIIPEEELQAYGLYTLDAQFLFDQEMFLYLREILQRILSYNKAKSEIDRLPAGDTKGEFKKIRQRELDWIIQQGDDKTGFATRFLPFLVYTPRLRPWWLRWP